MGCDFSSVHCVLFSITIWEECTSYSNRSFFIVFVYRIKLQTSFCHFLLVPITVLEQELFAVAAFILVSLD